MKLYSTNNKNQFFSLREAVLKGLPDDNGLFMPSHIPALPSDFLENIKDFSFPEIALTMARTLLQNAVPDADLERIIYDAINFSAPLVGLDEHTSVLELFHGPSLAFKDFGARFMAQLMSYFNQNADKELVILVATSGDTGGAVAAGFFKTLGIKVVILYPSGKVTPLQEKQLTTLGHNISALEINGTFDDCQALVKQAFLDNELTKKIRLSSANSINPHHRFIDRVGQRFSVEVLHKIQLVAAVKSASRDHCLKVACAHLVADSVAVHFVSVGIFVPNILVKL